MNASHCDGNAKVRALYDSQRAAVDQISNGSCKLVGIILLAKAGQKNKLPIIQLVQLFVNV